MRRELTFAAEFDRYGRMVKAVTYVGGRADSSREVLFDRRGRPSGLAVTDLENDAHSEQVRFLYDGNARWPSTAVRAWGPRRIGGSAGGGNGNAREEREYLWFDDEGRCLATAPFKEAPENGGSVRYFYDRSGNCVREVRWIAKSFVLEGDASYNVSGNQVRLRRYIVNPVKRKSERVIDLHWDYSQSGVLVRWSDMRRRVTFTKEFTRQRLDGHGNWLVRRVREVTARSAPDGRAIAGSTTREYDEYQTIRYLE